ncbi:hypothetical protein ACWC5I_39240, partial [Kitasatospora sp. NPDC001574]
MFVCPVTLAVCGVWLLPLWIKDGTASWGLATALGVAVSAPIPLWGQGYANRGEDRPGRDERAVTASGGRAVAVGGPIEGNISTGDSGTSAASLGSAPAGTSEPVPVPAPGPAAAPG